MSLANQYYCYILSNSRRTMLYIGYTECLKDRIEQHVKGTGSIYTKRYNVTDIIYFEKFETKKEAKAREKQ